jgi:hypothetical protein
MTASERSDARRRWAMAATASVLLHLSLLWWWKGADLRPGSGPAGGGGGHGAFAPGSVIDVQIDVAAPVSAGTKVPAEDVTSVVPTPDIPLPLPSPPDTSSQADSALAVGQTSTTTGSGENGHGTGSGSGAGTGSGDSQGAGTGDGGVPGGIGARTGANGGQPPAGVVPPRPIEITWPDTRKLSHCVGLRIDVRIRVDELGRVERVEPASQGLPADCVRAALDTAKRIKFTPGTVGGKPAPMWSLVTIDFEKRN